MSVPYHVFWVGLLVFFVVRYFLVPPEGKRKALGVVLTTLGLIVVLLNRAFGPITSDASAAAVCLTLIGGLAVFLCGAYLVFTKRPES